MAGKNEAIKFPSPAELGTTISLHARFGGGRKQHRTATAELIESKSVKNKKRAGVWVELFDSPHLNNAKNMKQTLANWIKANTMPWGDDGRRFVPNAIKIELDSHINKAITEIKGEMEKHFGSYIDQKKLWESEGGGLAQYGMEFPSEEVGRSKFEIEAIPGVITEAADVNVSGLTEEQKERFIKDVHAAENSRLQGTVRDVTSRVEDVLVRMVDRMGAYGKDENGKTVGKFHDTIVGNVREIAGLLGHFNITNDPEIENVRRRLVNEICVVTPDELREDPELRKDIKSKASDILSRVGQFGSKRD